MINWGNLSNWKSKMRFNRREVVENTTSIEENKERLNTLENEGGDSVDLTNVETDIIPEDNLIKNIGSSTNHFAFGHFNTITNASIFYIKIGTQNVFNATASLLNAMKTIRSSSTNNDLGQISYPFGDIYSVNAPTQTSDSRYKNTITESDLGLEFINKLESVSYKFNDVIEIDEDGNEVIFEHGRTHYGFTTQQVKSVLDEIGKSTYDFAGYVKEDINEESSKESLRYIEFISIQTKAIQELSKELERIKSDNNLV